MYIFDLTRAFSGVAALDELLDTIERFCRAEEIVTDDRAIFARPAQAPAVARGFAGRSVIVVDELKEVNVGAADYVTPRYVREFLLTLDGRDPIVRLCSFSPPVLSSWRELPPLPFRVETFHLGDIKKRARIVGPALWVGPPSMAESLEVLRRLLGHPRNKEGINQAELRPDLIALDDRFRVKDGQPISTLVLEAEKLGWVRLQGQQPNPRIIPMFVDDAADEPVVHDEAGDDSRPLSYRIEDILRQEQLGPFVKARRAIFDEIDANGLQAGESVTEFVSRVVDAGLAGVDLKRGLAYPVRTFIENVFTLAKVILDENGKPIPITISTLSSPVSSLCDGWRQQCEAELVYAVVRRISVTRDTRKDLAFALFNNADANPDGGLRAIERLFAVLLEQGRVEVTPDGRLVPLAVSERLIREAQQVEGLG